MSTHRWRMRTVRLGPLMLSVTLLKHTYPPGMGERWVLQTSTKIDRRGRR